MIKEKSVQEVFEAAKIEDIVQDYVNLKRRGANLLGLCPFHTEKTPSFTVSPSKNIYKCFGCGEGGNAVQFLMAHLQISFPEAIRQIAERYGIELEETGNTEEAIVQRQYLDSLYLINQYARDYYQKQLFESDRGKSIGLNYFKERGFREETIRKFGLGYAPNGKDTFTRRAVMDGYSKELLQKLGLTTSFGRDFFRSRVMFAIHNTSGKVIGFGGRILGKDIKAPKYINTPETDIYNKSKVLYGAFFARRAIRKEDECILVEGYTDVISLHQSGIEHVVASSGTSLTEDQIRLIKRHTTNIKMLFDGDLAGTKAALRGLDMVLEQDLNVKIVMLPEGEDPDSYLQAVGVSAFKTYIEEEARDFILFKATLLLDDAAGDPVKKTNAIKDIVSSIARIPDPIKRSLFVQECARIVEVQEQLLISEVNKLVSRQIKKQIVREQRIAGDSSQNAPDAPLATQHTHQGVVPSSKHSAAKVSGDQFQEKDIVRILVAAGDRVFDDENGTTIGQFIIANIEDVLEEFDNTLYLKLVRESQARLAIGRTLDSNFFVNHKDEEISSLAINLISSPYEYSENWEKKWDIFLQTQKMPEENFHLDALSGLRQFRLRKIKRMIKKNKLKIEEAHKIGKESEVSVLMKVHMELKQIEKDLTDKTGTVVWG